MVIQLLFGEAFVFNKDLIKHAKAKFPKLYNVFLYRTDPSSSSSSS